MKFESYFIILSSWLLWGSQSGTADGEEFNDVLKSYNKIAAAFFISGCNNIESRRGRQEAFSLILTFDGGELFSFRSGVFYREAVVNFDESRRKFIYDPYGGLWNHAYINDVIDYLLEQNFELQTRLTFDEVIETAYRKVCRVEHIALDKYEGR